MAATSMLRVAAVQWRSGPDPVANLASLGQQVRLAAAQGARLVVAPEASLACFGTPLASVAEPLDGPFVTGLRALAAETGIWLVAGTFVPAQDGKVSNVAVATDGETLVSYTKIHLFDGFNSRESDEVTAGTELVSFDLDFDQRTVRLGLAVCMDLRFADHFTALRRAGCQLVCVPTSWGSGPDKAEQLQLLARVRAMDSQAHLIMADQAGLGDGSSLLPRVDPLGIGRSLIAGPLGQVWAQAAETEQVVMADLDLALPARLRQTLPLP